MPLCMINRGETSVIKRIGGNAKTRQFLENLGFVAGAEVSVVSETNGNLIVSIKDTRIALGKEMANHIMV